MLTKDQWMKIAEAEAAASYGKKYAGFLMFRRFMAGPLGVVVGALVLGAALYFGATHLHAPKLSAGHLPTVFWIVVVGLALVTFVVFRPGRIVPAAATLVRAVVFAMLWLGVVAYGFFTLI